MRTRETIQLGPSCQGPGERPGGPCACGEVLRKQNNSKPQRVLRRPGARWWEGWGALSQADDPASGAGEPKEVQRQDQRAAGLRSQGRLAGTCKPAITYLPGSERGLRGLSPNAGQTPMKTPERLERKGKGKRVNIKRARRGRKGGERKQGKDVRNRERGVSPSMALGGIPRSPEYP